MDTSCKDCVFARYTGVQHERQTQVGCEFNLIEKYKQLGVVVDEAYDDSIPEREFFVVRGRLCRYKRNNEWLAQKNTDNLGTAMFDAEQELKLKVDAIVYVGDTHSIGDLFKTLVSLTTPELKPQLIIIILNTQKIFPSEIFDMLEDDPNNLTYTFHTVPYKVCLLMQAPLTLENALWESLPNASSMWLAQFQAGYKVPATYFSDINDALNQKLDRFLCLTGDNQENGTLINTKLCKKVGGVANLVKLTAETGETHLVKKVGEICQNM